MHRKRIHTKLGIASQGALFSLFLEALSHAPPNAVDDPLVYRQERAHGAARRSS